MEFEQPRSHERQICLHGLARRQSCTDNGVIDRRVGDFLEIGPIRFHAVERPCVSERRTRGFAAQRRVVYSLRVERRVEVDEIDALRVYAAQHLQVVVDPQRPVQEVRRARRVGDLRHHCSGLDREVAFAAAAPVRHLGVCGIVSVV